MNKRIKTNETNEPKGYLLFDYDGTLVDGSIGFTEVSERTKEAISKARANGYRTLLATGRSKFMTKKIWDLFDGFITTNGMYGEVDGVVFREAKLPKDLTDRIVEYLKERPESICGTFERQDYAGTVTKESRHYHEFISYFALNDSDFFELDQKPDSDYYKVNIKYDSREAQAEFEQAFKGDMEIIDHPLEDYTECMLPGCTKGAAVEEMITNLKIDPDQIYAFGDSENDVTMLKTAGHAIVMGKHSPGMEDIAEMITKRVEEEGIEYALKYLNII